MSQAITDSQYINAITVLSKSGGGTNSKKTSRKRIRLRDSRELYLLIGECRTLGADGIAWRRLLTKRLHDVFDADHVSFMDTRVVANPGVNADWIQPISTVERSCTDSSSYSPITSLIEGIRQPGPLSQATLSCQGAHVVSPYETLLGHEWSKGLLKQGDGSITKHGDFIVCINRCTDEKIQFLSLVRHPDKPPFPRRVVHLLRALWIELRLYQPEELRTVESSVFAKYPKRMLQVLACLLAGNTAKETAVLLSISVHTVQEHIKRLYKRTNTSNRAELADCFRDVAPQLIGTPLEEFLDYRPS